MIIKSWEEGIIVAAPEEIANRYRMIDKKALLEVANKYSKLPYGDQLRLVAEGWMPK